MTMLPLSARETVPYIPRAYRDQPDPPVFQIGVPTVLGRAQWRRSVAAHGAQYPDDDALLDAVRAAIEFMVDPADRDKAVEALEAYRAMAPGDRPAELTAKAAELEEMAFKLDERYAALRAERTYWGSVAPLLAFRQFVAGWSGLKAEYAREPEGVSALAMQRVPEALLNEVGLKAIELMTVTEDQEKN